MFTIEIPRAQLAAAIELAPAKDKRTYLNGVFVDAHSACLVATDGTAMYIGRPGSVRLTAGAVMLDTILPIDFCKDVLKSDKSNVIAVTMDDANQCVTSTRIARVLDGRYPTWRAVYPAQLTPVADLQIDNEILARVTKANKALGAKWPGVFALWSDATRGAAIAVLGAEQAHVIIQSLRAAVTKPIAFSRFDVA